MQRRLFLYFIVQYFLAGRLEESPAVDTGGTDLRQAVPAGMQMALCSHCCYARVPGNLYISLSDKVAGRVPHLDEACNCWGRKAEVLCT